MSEWVDLLASTSIIFQDSNASHVSLMQLCLAFLCQHNEILLGGVKVAASLVLGHKQRLHQHTHEHGPTLLKNPCRRKWYLVYKLRMTTLKNDYKYTRNCAFPNI